VQDPSNSREYDIHGRGEVPVGEFADIEWVIGKEAMMIKVNGELRHIGNDYPYVAKYAEDAGYTLNGTVAVAAAWGSTVTVESLSVTEL
jgi:hypothetical protein